MRLTTLSDYALRLLIYAAAHDRLVTIEEASTAYGVSRAHLMKIASILTRGGYLRAVRGRAGGLTLAKAPHEINLGALLRLTEPDFALVECFAERNRCVISKRCGLPRILSAALDNFLSTFDQFTLADVMPKERPIRWRMSPTLSLHGQPARVMPILDPTAAVDPSGQRIPTRSPRLRSRARPKRGEIRPSDEGDTTLGDGGLER